MPRESISMSREEIAGFLKGEGRLVLGTLGEDGSPWADAAPCLFQDGYLFFRIPRGSQSYRNIRRDSRVCCILERNPSYYEIIGAVVHGRAREVTDGQQAQRIGAALDALGDPVQLNTGLEAPLLFVGLDDVASFDFSKIQRRG